MGGATGPANEDKKGKNKNYFYLIKTFFRLARFVLSIIPLSLQ